MTWRPIAARLRVLGSQAIPLIAATLTIVVITSTLLFLPPLMVEIQVAKSDQKTAELVDKYRITMAQSIGGLAILIGVYFTARNVFATEQTRWTKTFTDAINQLGTVNDKTGNAVVPIRVGAIYALERLSRDSPADAHVISRILADYIQVETAQLNVEAVPVDTAQVTVETAELTVETPQINAGQKAPGALRLPRTDIAAAMTSLMLIARGKALRKDDPVVLYDLLSPDLDLSGRTIGEIRFVRSTLSGSRFDQASCKRSRFEDCQMDGCQFISTRLSGSIFNNCVLAGGNFSMARATDSRFLSVDLSNAEFVDAVLIRVEFSGLDLSLIGADFTRAVLKGAVFSECDLSDAWFQDADLSNADMRTARNLTEQQLSGAKVRPPARLLPPLANS